MDQPITHPSTLEKIADTITSSEEGIKRNIDKSPRIANFLLGYEYAHKEIINTHSTNLNHAITVLKTKLTEELESKEYWDAQIKKGDTNYSKENSIYKDFEKTIGNLQRAIVLLTQPK